MKEGDLIIFSAACFFIGCMALPIYWNSFRVPEPECPLLDNLEYNCSNGWHGVPRDTFKVVLTFLNGARDTIITTYLHEPTDRDIIYNDHYCELPVFYAPDNEFVKRYINVYSIETLIINQNDKSTAITK